MIRIGVIGTGVMGAYHVRALSEMDGVKLIAISDINEEKVKKLAEKYRLEKYYTGHRQMLEEAELDGVIVAVPPAAHKRVALDCIEKGVNVLVEKPLAHNLKDAEEIIKKAGEKGVVLTVGHIERFNPVVTKIKEFIDQGLIGNIYLVNTVRVGPFPQRLYGLQEGVLIDLAVHDVDIINYLAGGIKQVYSQLISNEKQEIYAQCLFQVSGDIKASSEFSWVSPKKTRTIEIFGEKGMLKGDYQEQTVVFHENSDENEAGRALMDGKISEGKIISFPVQKEEPLKVELKRFVDAISGKAEVLVKPHEAKEALKVALGVLESGKGNKAVGWE